MFLNQTRGQNLADRLSRAEFNAAALQGNMSQNARDKVMNGFKAGRHKILVTDIAARGIDVSGVPLINYDISDTPEAYTHRIGRTGRAECTGTACTFVTSEDRQMLRAIERRIEQEIPERIVEEFLRYDGVETKNRPQRARKKPGSRNTARTSGKPSSKESGRKNNTKKTNASKPSRSRKSETESSFKQPPARRTKQRQAEIDHHAEEKKANS